MIFLADQFTEGKQYHTAHQPIDGVAVGQHPLVSRLMKGIFNLRSPGFTWDIGQDTSELWSVTRTLT